MPPQGQDTPQPTPNPTPAPQDAPQQPPAGQPAFNPAQPPAPAPAPNFGAPQHGVMPGGHTAGQPKKSPVMLISIIAGAIVLIGGGILAYFLLFTGISLETYNNDKYSMSVPVGYTKEEDGDGIIFKEPGTEATASSAFTYYAEFPSTLSKSQLDTVKSTLKSQLQSRIGSLTSGDKSISDLKVEDSSFKGKDAIKVSGKAKSSGSTGDGVVKMYAIVESDKLVMFGVAADASDPGLISKIDTILDSFTLK